MSETIDAIQEKLTFSNIADQVKETVSDQISSAVETARDAVYDATIGKAGDFVQNVGRGLSDVTENVGDAFGDTGTSLMRAVRRNPIPFALAGLGISFLFIRQRSRRKRIQRSYEYDYDYDSQRYVEGTSSRRIKGRHRDKASNISRYENIGETEGGLSNMANQAYEGVSSAANQAYKGVSKGLGNVTESAGDVGTYIARQARSNPLPMALIGLGLGMLILQNRTSSSRSYNYDYESSRRGRGRGRGRNKGNDRDQSNQQSILGRAGETASDVANTAYSGVTGAASTAYEGVSTAASTAYDQVGNVGSTVRHYAGQAQDQYEQYLETSPLAVGAVALALGAAVGFTIPATEYENEWMGEYREDLVQKAQEVARGAIDKVQQVAGEVSRTVSEEAQNQGAGQ
jgi:hypothetical protein